MIHIEQNAKTLILVVHEIYGINEQMKMICTSLAGRGFDVMCPNLLQHKTAFDYAQEEIAYRHFREEVGFEKAAQFIKSCVREQRARYSSIYLVGFSVGATIAWLCSGEEGIKGVVGFYGSRIRDYAGITPSCSVLLFFPEEEPFFSVDELIAQLKEKEIELYQLPGQHGFADPYSKKYREESAKIAFQKMDAIFLPD
ncbi:dienelactone hydrolase family protein [Brevibacillus ruminantium]|uniref:Dienelactone hydrolase family protein n=1 Tax=Brevibacillus ruminantium TaxID=2950604 RepID=A0ABY4WMF9_9BACL|nr:dienelactone hydrolase family protein [Brevibacillus ruminantium]